MNKFRKWIIEIFTPKQKEALTEIAENMASFIGRTHSPKDRILILKNLQSRILADLITEKKEAETKYDECVKAINELNNPEGF